MFYLIMKDGDNRRWWNMHNPSEDDSGSWGTRQAATRYLPYETQSSFSLLPPGGKWVGPCDGTED